MQKNLHSLLQLTVGFGLLIALPALAQDKKVDPTGTWKWSITTQSGQTRETTLKLKLEGDKLTGTISGRQNETAIQDGKLTGDEVSFKVTREFNGNTVTSKYTGKITGDTMKGKMEFDRDGEARTREFEAKREPAK